MKDVFVELEPGVSERLSTIHWFAEDKTNKERTTVCRSTGDDVSFRLCNTPYAELKKRIEEANGQI